MATDYVQGKMNTHRSIMQKVLWCEAKSLEYTERAKDLKGEAQKVLDLVEEIKALEVVEKGYLDEAERLTNKLPGSTEVKTVLADIETAKANAASTAAKIRSLYYGR